MLKEAMGTHKINNQKVWKWPDTKVTQQVQNVFEIFSPPLHSLSVQETRSENV